MPDTPDAESAHFGDLLSSGEFSGSEIEVKILQTLFDLRQTDRTAALTQDELQARLGSELTRNPDSLRSTILKLRGKLANYNNKPGRPVRIEIPRQRRRYRLVVNIEPQTLSYGSSDVVRILFHRGGPDDRLEDILCAKSEFVLYVSIASQPAYYQQILPWFEQHRVKTKHFCILTWQPVVPAPSEDPVKVYAASPVVRAYAKILGQTVQGVAENIARAWKMWKDFEKSHASVEVRGYKPIPTLLGVCNDQAVKVELLPFNYPLGGPRVAGERPAFFMRKPTPGYWYFRECFEDLWIDAMSQKDVYLGRHERNALLQTPRPQP